VEKQAVLNFHDKKQMPVWRNHNEFLELTKNKNERLTDGERAEPVRVCSERQDNPYVHKRLFPPQS
jgi:hypothetical protein